MVFVGTAAWTIPKKGLSFFPPEGSHLERYSRVMNAVEINSSFYREHSMKSYERWRISVPADFKFSVKLARAFIHDCKLRPPEDDLHASILKILGLREKLGVLLVQLPASLKFDRDDAHRFFSLIREKYHGPLALEPRNTTWISDESRGIYPEFRISKVIADPEKCESEDPTVLRSSGMTYHRLHGSPEIYKSSYSKSYLRSLAQKIGSEDKSWCIFDNTTFGEATLNALELKRLKNENRIHS